MVKKTEKNIDYDIVLSKPVDRRGFLRFSSTFAILTMINPKLSFAGGSNNVKIARSGVQSNDTSRVVIETSSKPEYSTFYLDNPNRIVVDIKNANISNLKKQNVKANFISNIRANMFTSTTARFVIDLNSSSKIKKKFVLNPVGDGNYRLVLDIQKGKEIIIQKRKPELSKKKIIIIDPGHGGKDPGAIGKKGTYEKNIVLMTAFELKKFLEGTTKYKVIMTRSNDKYISLKKRSQIAEDNNAALFLSIHADSHSNSKTKGLSVYTLSDKATDQEAMKLAEKENASDLIGLGSFEKYNPTVKNILGDLLQTQTKEESMDYANTLVKEIKKSKKIASLPRKPHRQAPFAVLKSSIPSALIELGYLSNREEEKLLTTNSYRRELAKSITNSVLKKLG